jgi:hypothetical protein
MIAVLVRHQHCIELLRIFPDKRESACDFFGAESGVN